MPHLTTKPRRSSPKPAAPAPIDKAVPFALVEPLTVEKVLYACFPLESQDPVRAILESVGRELRAVYLALEGKHGVELEDSGSDVAHMLWTSQERIALALDLHDRARKAVSP